MYESTVVASLSLLLAFSFYFSCLPFSSDDIFLFVFETRPDACDRGLFSNLSRRH